MKTVSIHFQFVTQNTNDCNIGEAKEGKIIFAYLITREISIKGKQKEIN